MKPLVSVCIPTFNGAKYFRECLDSVFAQTFTDFEVLIVDDQSSDETFSIAQEYATYDHRFRVLQNKHNLGLVGNWNRCVELAQGEWIKFVFQDDLIAPLCLERMLATSRPESAIIFCRRDLIFESGTSEATRQHYLKHVLSRPTGFSNLTEISANDYCEAILARMGINIVGEPIAVLLRRSVFYRFGFFNPQLILICDLEFWTRVAVHTGITLVPETLATFRVNSGSVSSRSLASRMYRLTKLDLLVMLHEFAFNPLYTPLRTAASCHQPSINLARMFTIRAKIAWLIANQAANTPKNPDRSLLEEWENIENFYPLLSIVSKCNFLERTTGYLLIQLKWYIETLLKSQKCHSLLHRFKTN